MTPPLDDKPGYGLKVGREIIRLDKQVMIIGRAETCDIVLTSALASRQHARLFVSADSVSIEDMGSRNGVLVNGSPIESIKKLAHGDTVILGDEHLTVVLLLPERGHTQREVRMADTLVGEVQSDPEEATRRSHLLEVLGGVVDKQLALGHGAEAERLLSKQLRLTLERAKLEGIDPVLNEQAARYAIKLGDVTKKSEWIVYAISIYHYQRRVMPVALVDELYSVLRRVRGVPVDVVRSYLSELRAKNKQLSPAERFALKRIEGLEHLVLL